MEERSFPTWSWQTKLVVSLLLLVGLGFLFYKFSSAIGPVVLALIFAYILSPLVNRLQKGLHCPRWLAVLIVYILFLVIIGLALWLVIPMLIDQARRFVQSITTLLQNLEDIVGDGISIGPFFINQSLIFEQASTSLQSALQPMLGQTINIVGSVLSSLLWVVFILIISFYLVKDGRAIFDWFEKLALPAFRPVYRQLLGELNIIWSAFFRGQLLLALIVSVILTVEGLVIGLPYALVMGIIGGLMEFLPSVGHGIWLVLASLLALILGSTWLPIPNWAFFLLILMIHLIFTQFDLNYLIPRVIGRSVHLPPLVVILGIVAGAAVAGVMGVVLAAPTIASLRVLGRYIYAQLFGNPDLTREPSAPPLPPPDPYWWQKRIPPAIRRNRPH